MLKFGLIYLGLILTFWRTGVMARPQFGLYIYLMHNFVNLHILRIFGIFDNFDNFGLYCMCTGSVAHSLENKI